MAEAFDQDRAEREQREVLEQVQHIRNGLNVDVIDYYWDRTPDSEEEDRRNRDGMRKYLRLAEERISELLRRRLD